MYLLFFKNTVLLFVLTVLSCGKLAKTEDQSFKPNETAQDSLVSTTHQGKKIKTGAENFEAYLPLINGKKIGVVTNQTGVVPYTFRYTSVNENGEDEPAYATDTISIVDFLLKEPNSVKKIFSPEHGFRGQADAAEHVADGVDVTTGLPIISLHGKTRKPLPEHLQGLDMMVFDIQDVGVRFYTYISTLHYVMEACAENNIPLLVLDRPNPNGHYVDGPVLEMTHKSFVGMHPVALVHGMTIGEYAQMINGKKWLKNGVQCDLTVIPCLNYTRDMAYSLPVKPSPNLPNDKAINLYPSLGLFEGTTINAGRGTDFQFQRYGAPFFPKAAFSYTPKPNAGAKHPKHEGKLCYGMDLSQEPELDHFTLKYIIDAYKKTPKGETFFGPTFTIHAGSETLQKQIEQGLSEEAIRATWREDLERFKQVRARYLLYP